MKTSLRFLVVLFFALSGAFIGCGQSQELGNGTCKPGLNLCGTSCVDNLSDPNNCGGCGRVCGADQVCQGAACVSTCSASYSSCDGACVQLDVNDQNCGSCGNACTGEQHCGNRECFTCPANTTACYSQNGYWSCANFALDNLNCGGCGKRCSINQECTNGVCR